MTITENEKRTVLKLLAGGRTTEFAARAVSLDVDTVTRLASHHGYPDRSKLAWAADIIERNVAEARAATAVTRPPAPRPVAVQANPVADTIANLIARGKKAEQSPKVRRAADRAETAIETLRGLLNAETAARRAAAAKAEQREHDKAAKQREAAERRARIAELERQIRELRKTAKPQTASVAVTTTTAERTGGATPKAVRAWAATAGVECASMGRVPQSVIDLYVAAQGGSS